MKAKEKADELIYKFLSIICYNTRPIDISHPHAKQCALIAVDEMLKEHYHLSERGIFWQEVKQEIEKL